MKCPLILNATFNVGLLQKIDMGSCLKEECAWWGEYVFPKGKRLGCCSISAIALALSDISNKMPTEE